MNAFRIYVSKCRNCPYAEHVDDWGRAGVCTESTDRYLSVYLENLDGITPSCPMFSQSVEVEG